VLAGRVGDAALAPALGDQDRGERNEPTWCGVKKRRRGKSDISHPKYMRKKKERRKNTSMAV
jgi:hypothetical protein